MGEFSQLQVWRDPAIAGALAWYRQVAENRMPARFRIAATISVTLSVDDAPEEALWRELERLTSVFLERCAAIREGREPLGAGAEGPSLLDLCRALAYRMLAHCNFCRWDCRVDRSRGAKFGACKLDAGTRVSSHFHHPGEERIYRGIARLGDDLLHLLQHALRVLPERRHQHRQGQRRGDRPRTLATMAWMLRARGLPQHQLGRRRGHHSPAHDRRGDCAAGRRPRIRHREDLSQGAAGPRATAVLLRFESGAGDYEGAFNAPMLWNSNFFMTDEAMEILRVLTDVWLPDFKFGPGRCAMSLARTPWYWETVTGNLLLSRDGAST